MEIEERIQIITKRLRQARIEADLSQAKVAKLMGVKHQPTIKDIESGLRRIRVDELARFAEIYKVELMWLLGEPKVDPSVSKDPIINALEEYFGRDEK